MPTYSMKAPNGKTYQVEGPDGATDDQVRAEILRQFPHADATPLDVTVTDDGLGDFQNNPDFQKQLDLEKRPTSFVQGFNEGFNQVFDNGAAALEWGLDKVGLADPLNRLGESMGMAPNVEAARQARQLESDASPTQGSGFGHFAGNVVASLPTAALPGGAFVQGAAGGALTTNARDLAGIAMDAGFGALGGKTGEIVLRGAANVAAPVVNDTLRTLIDAGVNVTPGQVARSRGGAIGNYLARSEDRAVSTPFVGDRVAAARNNSLETFGRATINRSLEPIGLSLPDNISGRRAVAYAGDRLGEAYDAILPRLSATGNSQFADDLARIHEEASMMEPGRATQFRNILGGMNRYWRDGVSLDGQALKDIETRIGERVRRAAMSTDADQRELGDRLGDVLSAVRDLAARQNPAEADALSSINRGWKSLTQVERAAGNSRGNITPSGYSQAVKQSSDTARRRGYARGEALNQDLSDAASDILPSEIADSGTAARWQQSNMLANLIGAAQVPAYAAARGLTPMLTREASPAAQNLAEIIRYGSRAAPIVAPASIQALSQ